MKVQKTISLTADTLAISNKMENFSGWIRARLRQYEENVDPVELDLKFQSMKLRYKTLTAAINEQNDEVEADIFHLFNEMMAQRTLEDFE